LCGNMHKTLANKGLNCYCGCMRFDAATLPDTLTELKALFVATQQQYESEIKLLQEEISILKHRLFGRKSEKLPVGSGQLLLFNEAEAGEPEEQGAPAETIAVPAHERRRGCRKPLPDNLPRVAALHDLTDEQKQCACGEQKSRIGEEVSEQLDIMPPKIQVIQHIRPKYVCKKCEGTAADEAAVSIAPMPEQMIPKSIATPGLLAWSLTGKFVDALPFYRIEKILERYGVEVSRQTLCCWAIKVAERCWPLLELMQEDILAGFQIQADETPLQVLQEEGRAPTSRSYMWLFRGGTEQRPVIRYQYHESRSGQVAKEFLKDYPGYVQTDGYLGYDFLGQMAAITHLGCWAHVRRKFVEMVNAAGKDQDGKKKTGSGDVALDYIGKLYLIEKECAEQQLKPEQIARERQSRAGPILDQFKEWLDKRSHQVPPGSTLGKAISYTLGQWERLVVYLKDGRLRPDNNLAENAIRPFVVGRKNWLFAATPDGAHASAALYSIIETAKANGLEPYWYLRYLFERLPGANTKQEHRKLLPQYVDRSLIGRP
jgi:transposase